MSSKFTNAAVLLLLSLIASCTSATEKQGIEEVGRFYGGNVGYSKGSNVSTNAEEPQGKYLEIKLNGANLEHRFSDLHMPASNCAYLVYNRLTPTEQQAYNYFKVSLSDSGASHSYTFPQGELQNATQAANNLTTLMTDIQQHEYLAVANIFNPAALGTISPDSLPTMTKRVVQKIGSINDYSLQGYDLISAPIAGKPEQFVRLFVSISQPEPVRKLLVVVNPKLHANQKFLYGLNLLN